MPTENYSADILDKEEFTIYKLTALADRHGSVTVKFVDAVNCEHENSFTTNRVSIRHLAAKGRTWACRDSEEIKRHLDLPR